MKKTGILFVLVVLLAVTTVVMADAGGIPAWPAQPGSFRPDIPSGKIVGERLNIVFGGEEINYPANEPFYIAHGWSWVMPRDFKVVNDKGDLSYSLEMDGVPLKRDFINVHVTPPLQDAYGDFIRTTLWVYNFPKGLEGTHVFVSKYWVFCQGLVDNGVIPGPCDDPKELIMWGEITTIVTFD